jgi:transposase-like protein
MTCYYCGSKRTVRNGRTSNGKQRFVCRTCERCLRASFTGRATSPERKADIL